MSDNMQIFESMKNPSVKIKMEKREERIKNLVANTDYIEWLNEFTLINGDFYENDWEYSNTKLPKEEMENVKKLGDFYEAINEYAARNYIYPESDKFTRFYRVRYDANMFNIGGIFGQGSEFFCVRKKLDDESKYLDIEDVINNKVQPNKPIIEKSLDQLSNTIITLHEDGVPYIAIEDSVNKTLMKIKNSE